MKLEQFERDITNLKQYSQKTIESIKKINQTRLNQSTQQADNEQMESIQMVETLYEYCQELLQKNYQNENKLEILRKRVLDLLIKNKEQKDQNKEKLKIEERIHKNQQSKVNQLKFENQLLKAKIKAYQTQFFMYQLQSIPTHSSRSNSAQVINIKQEENQYSYDSIALQGGVQSYKQEGTILEIISSVAVDESKSQLSQDPSSSKIAIQSIKMEAKLKSNEQTYQCI